MKAAISVWRAEEAESGKRESSSSRMLQLAHALRLPFVSLGRWVIRANCISWVGVSPSQMIYYSIYMAILFVSPSSPVSGFAADQRLTGQNFRFKM